MRAVKSLAEIEDTLRQADVSALPGLDLVVLRNIVVEPIEPYLRLLAYEMGHQARVRFGEYDQIIQEAVGGRPDLLNQDTACVAVFAVLDLLSPDLARHFAGLSSQAVDAEMARIGSFIDDTLAGIRRQTSAMILWHGFEEPLFPALGIVDVQRTDGQAGVVRTLNDRLRTALGRTGNAYLVDLNACLTRRGAATFYDRRYWHMARAPYSREALADIAREQFKYLRALKGRQRKCLVLDCDDVLWGGVLGEEGIAGIKIGRAYPGSPYLELQQEILNLYHRGVVLALCSKNDASDVWDVFRNHPDMVLRENHIAAARINWNDKATNLREIAAELNLGLDALVFVDDSEVECDLVRRALPDVAVVHVPRDQAVDYRERIAAGGWFDTLTLSDEDRRRGAAYKAEGERQRLRTASTDLDSYFQSLEMVARIRKADRVTIPRIAQLTQKTNQFNMTTRRYSDEDISRFAADPATEVLTLSLEDRFGDAGLVGVAILRYEGATARLDTFLLSCRVLGRGVEDAFLGECLARAQRRHAAVAVGEFVATKKNQMAAGFYSARGFRPGASGHLELPLADWSRVLPSFFKRVEGPDEPASQQV